MASIFKLRKGLSESAEFKLAVGGRQRSVPAPCRMEYGQVQGQSMYSTVHGVQVQYCTSMNMQQNVT
jgi:hypothetical protein